MGSRDHGSTHLKGAGRTGEKDHAGRGSDLGIGTGRLPHEPSGAPRSTGRAPTHAGRGFLAGILD